jgi:hypothetical protein
MLSNTFPKIAQFMGLKKFCTALQATDDIMT